MRPSILPTIALVLMLIGAGAFGAWFVMNQEEPPAPPIAALPDAADDTAAAKPAPAVVDRPVDTAEQAEAPKADKPKSDPNEAAKKTVDVTDTDAAKKLESERRSAYDAAREAVKRAVPAVEGANGEIDKELEALQNALVGKPIPFEATIVGTVTDNKGQPVPGASVYADVSEMIESGSRGAMVGLSFAGRDMPKGTPVATTDAAGSFTATIKRQVNEKSRVTVSLTAKAEGYAISRPNSITVKNGETKDGVKLAMRGAGSVSGRVIDGSGRGVEGVKVSLGTGGVTYAGATVELPGFAGGGSGGENATSDSAGNFTISGVPEGRHKISARANGWRQISGPSEVTVTSGTDARLEDNFKMAAATQLTVKLATAEGKPVVGYVTVLFKDGATTTRSMGGMAGADGALALNDVPVGTFDVEIRAFGYKPVTVKETFTDGQTTSLGSQTVEKAEGAPGARESIILPGSHD